MRPRTFLNTAICLIATLVLRMESAAQDGLLLEVRPASPPGATALIVDVVIRNAGESSPLISPFIFPEGRRSHHPTNVLRFDVTAPDGSLVPFVGEGDAGGGDFGMLRFCDLLAVSPGALHGLRVNLNAGPFAHRITLPGQYRVRAAFVSEVGRWFRSWRKPYKDSTFLPGHVSRVFDGTLRSEEIVVSFQ